MTSTTVLRAPGVPRTLTLALLGRVPLGAVSLLVVLYVRHLGHSYALAGLCAGACSLGTAFGSPLVGRAADRVGQTVVMTVTGVVVAVACVAFVSLPAHAPVLVFVAVALAVGAALPPLASCARALWRRLLPGDDFGVLITLDASFQELAFVSGPLVLVSVASVVGPGATLLITGSWLSASALLYAALPETRRLGRGDRGGSEALVRPRGGALSSSAVRVLLVVAVAIGVGFGASELGLVTLAEHLNHKGATGVLFAVWGVGSFVGGVAWTRLAPARQSPLHSVCLLTVLPGLGSLPLGLSPSVVVLGIGLAVTGLAMAPLLGIVYGVMGDIAPAGTLTEAFTIQMSALTSGIAIGSAVAGALASSFGPAAAFVLAGGALLVAGALARAGAAIVATAAGRPDAVRASGRRAREADDLGSELSR